MTKARARNVNESLLPFMIKPLEGMYQIEGKKLSVVLIIQKHNNGLAMGFIAQF
jgi:hypothetical protein